MKIVDKITFCITVICLMGAGYLQAKGHPVWFWILGIIGVLTMLINGIINIDIGEQNVVDLFNEGNKNAENS